MKAMHNCAMCGGSFEASRRDARYCSAACRAAAWRGDEAVEQPAAMPGAIEREARVLLRRMGADESEHMAIAALACARAMDDPHTPPGALVGLSKELPEALRYLREVHSDDA